MGEAEGGDKIEEGEDTAAPPRTKPAAHAHTRRRGERERSRVVEREREGEGARATRRRTVYLYVGFEEPCKRGERRRRDAFTPGLPPSLQWFWLLAEVCGLAMHGARWRRAAAEQGEFSMARAPRGWWWWWPASSFSRWRRGNGRPGRYP
jgi:hypothetical protein